MKLLQSLFGFFIQWYDNGIYYPNIFLFVIFLTTLIAGTTAWMLFAALFPRILHKIIYAFGAGIRIIRKKWNGLMHLYRNNDKTVPAVLKLFFTLLRKKVSKLASSAVRRLQKDPLMVFIALLIITIITRFSVSYFDVTHDIVAPEKIFQLGIFGSIGRDLYVGVYEPSLALIGGKGFYTPTSATGPALLSIAGPFIHAAFQQGYCAFTTMGCFYYFYKIFLMVSFVAYALFILLAIYGRPKSTRYSLFIYSLIFLLGIPGSIGLERGNIDVLLSALVGFILLITIYASKQIISPSQRVVLSIIIGIMAGFIANTKLFLIPVSLIFVFASPSPLITLLMGGSTFLAFASYLPRTFFAVDATIEDLFWANTNGMGLGSTYALFFDPQRLSLTHSTEAIASLFSDCVRNVSCMKNGNTTFIISFISKMLLFGTIGIPVISSILLMLRIIKHGSLRFLDYFRALRTDKRMILFYFILTDAVINLVPRISFIYRLYYSLPIVLLTYAETRQNSRARFYCFLSMIALAIKGFWINYLIEPKGISLFDARAFNGFILLHFFFLIRAGLTGIEDRLKTILTAKNIN